ncbi:MAG: sulfatase [Kiritimatiellales bacterium]|nr:sulfatase [Kiritimatiellales bacterium]
MKRMAFPWIVALLCIVVATPAARAADAARRNILFFLVDDQRDDVLGCYGNSIVKTPTINRIASEGVRFANSFCEVPICAASRTSIFTGLSQRTHGYNFSEPAVSAKYIATSYPMMLKAAGYRVGFAGKYGVKFAKPDLSSQFDFFEPIDRNPYLKTMPDGSLRHETDLCADAAIEFINSTPPDQPFCMSVSFNASHAEDGDHRPGYHFQWPSSTDGMYEDIEIPAPRLGDEKYFKAIPPFLQDEQNLNRKRYFWRWDTPEKYQINMRAYYRMASGIDNAIARVLEELKAKGLDQNTVIVYSADNGYMLADRGLAGKWNHYEQSLRVPLIIYDPTVPKQQRGSVVKELVSNIDLAPTFLQLAGVEPPDSYQGHSLVPLAKREKVEGWRDDIYCEHKFKMFNNWYGVRGKKYKYAVYYDEPDGPYECLYDLEKDPDEFTNQAGNPEYAAVREMMKARLDSYLKSIPAVAPQPSK